MKVYLDGKFLDDTDAMVSVFDASVQHGVGLFETIRADGGVLHRLDDHLARLVESAKETGLTRSLRAGPLAEAVEMTLSKNKLEDARIRLTVTGGNLALLSRAKGEKPQPHQPSICITATEPTLYPDAFFREGVMVVIADAKANPFDPMAGHKTLHYWARLQSLAQAAASGAGESLWFSVTNHLCGGAVSNAFLVKDGQLHTPIARGEEAQGALPSAVLPGVTRGGVLEAAGRMNLPVHKRMLTINDVLEADELFLTNSSWLVLPVVRVEKKAIGSGKVGPVTEQLRGALLEELRTGGGANPV